MEEITQPCLLCDTPVLVDRAEWEAEESPLALCERCDPFVARGLIPWPHVQMIYVLRCQVANLYSKLAVVETHIKRLYAAQQELEQEFLRAQKQPRLDAAAV